jgi:hypothetical protein
MGICADALVISWNGEVRHVVGRKEVNGENNCGKNFEQ